MDVKVERLPAIWVKGLLSLFHIRTTSKWADIKNTSALSSNLYTKFTPELKKQTCQGKTRKVFFFFFFLIIDFMS